MNYKTKKMMESLKPIFILGGILIAAIGWKNKDKIWAFITKKP